MIEGTLDRKSKRSMVRVATFVSLLIASMVVVGAARAEDNESPRSSNLTTVVEVVPVPVPVPVPVLPIRKLTKNSSTASHDDAAVSEEEEDLLRLLVYETAVDLNRFSKEPSSIENAVDWDNYREYTCTGCVDLYTAGSQLTPEEQDEFCQKVKLEVKSKIVTLAIDGFNKCHGACPIANRLAKFGNAPFDEYCMYLLQCRERWDEHHSLDDSNKTPTLCCQSQGLCLAGLGVVPGKMCSDTAECIIPLGLEHGVCRNGKCQSGQAGARCGQTSDCLPIAGLNPPHAVCRKDKCQQ